MYITNNDYGIINVAVVGGDMSAKTNCRHRKTSKW